MICHLPTLKIIARQYLYALLLIIFSMGFMSAQTQATREYQIKAVFLFNFTQFIEWPDTSFSDPNEPMVIGILGENPFGAALNDAVAGEKVNGHPLVVKHYTSYTQIDKCHILFINESETNKLDQIATNLKEQNVLLVSDSSSDFLKQGGMIRLFTKKNQIQLQINLESTSAANLIVSSKLLRLAEIVSAK
jgi:hypothetical protein